MPPLSPQDESTEILQAALRLYRQFGPDKVSMDDIAKASGRSRTSIYYYFKSRDEIFRAATDAIVLEMAKELRKSVADIPTLGEQVYTFCVSKLRISREWKLILHSMWSGMNPPEQSANTRTIEGLHHQLVYQESLILKEILAAAVKKNQIRTLSADDTDDWTFIITSGIRGIRNEIADQNLTPVIKRSIRLLADMATTWLTTK